jgi:5-methylcytosine-specific restriction endonuclease McrA
VTARQFKGSYAWKRARRIALQGAYGCAICGGPFRLDLGHRHRLYPTVDHVIPLARLDLTSAAGRAVAVSQEFLRVVHNGCNASRGAREGKAREGDVRRVAERRAARSAYFAEMARHSREW